jgi:CBS domain-containing protein
VRLKSPRARPGRCLRCSRSLSALSGTKRACRTSRKEFTEENAMNTPPRVIAELMTPCPVSVSPHQSLSEAHAMMRSLGIRHLPVVEERRLVGVLSEGDLRLFSSRHKVDQSRTQVEEAMSQRPYAVGPDEPVAAVLASMLERHFGSAVIVDRGRVVGIFTSVDAMTCLRRLVTDSDPRPDATTRAAAATVE